MEATQRIPWCEKYRPRHLDGVQHQYEVIRVLKESVKTNNLSHVLLYGPPGTGKTTTILALARDLFGPELFSSRILELNASDERGIGVVREKIKSFARISASSTIKRKLLHNDWHWCRGKHVPPFKIVILDEADNLTVDAQHALRRTMEVHSDVTRFCLICNYVSRIIAPIASRCAKFRFKPLPRECMADYLREIGKKEDVELNDETVDALCTASGGDMRKAITYLQGEVQSAHQLFGASLKAADVVEISGNVPEQEVSKLIDACKSGVFSNVQVAVKAAKANAYSSGLFLEKIHEVVVRSSAEELCDEDKAQISLKVACADRALVDGADEYLQLLDTCAALMEGYAHTKDSQKKE